MVDAPVNVDVGPGTYAVERGTELGNGGLFETPPAWGFSVSERKPMSNEVG